MSYEILLTDTAREDLNQRTSATVHALLDRIAESAELDHTLSAPSSAFELRYQSLQSTYVFFRRSIEPSQVTVIYFCEMQVPQAVIPSAGANFRILDWQTRDIPHGMEVASTVELNRPDGARRLHRQLVRKVDLGESYTVFHHQAVGDGPSITIIITGKKGAIEGNFRHDEIALVVLAPDGSVQRLPPFTERVWIKSPFEGLSPEKTFEAVGEWVKSEEFDQRMAVVRKRMSELQGFDGPSGA